MVKINVYDIIEQIELFAPLSLQEGWDNSGLQVGIEGEECTGVLLCVDVTEDVVKEAVDKGCNLILSHHPILFHGLKRIDPDNYGTQSIVFNAIKHGIAIYSAHTSLDKAEKGLSYYMAKKIGGGVVEPLVPTSETADTGLGCIATFGSPVAPEKFLYMVKDAFGGARIRSSRYNGFVNVFAICTGAGGEFIPNAIFKACDAYITSEIRYHDFVDYGRRILLTDIGHFESEECSKEIFYEIISEKFPNFAVYKSATERNPIKYL